MLLYLNIKSCLKKYRIKINMKIKINILQTERREQHFTPGRFTSIKLPEGPPLEGVVQLLDFPRHRIRLLEKLGEGSFGLVINLSI